MKSWNRSRVGDSNIITYKNGVTLAVANGGIVERMSVIRQSVGPKPIVLKPTAFAFYKVLSQPLRGVALRNNESSGYLSQKGSFSTNLDADVEAYSVAGVTISNKGYAREKALGGLSDQIRPVDVSIDLFQYKLALQTANRLLHLTKTTMNSWKSMTRNGRFGPVKEAANLYLEYTYGIKPLLMTLYGVYKKLMEKGISGESLLHFRGRGHVNTYRTDSAQATLFQYTNCFVPVDIHESTRCQIDVYLKPDLNRLQKLSQYTSLNPVAWAYELTMYSFVLDYFWNFGGYLRSLEMALMFGWKFDSGCETYTREKLCQARPGQYIAQDTQSALKPDGGFHLFKEYDRLSISSFPLPRIPQFNVVLGSKQMLNIAALLAQFLPDVAKKANGGNRKSKLLQLIDPRKGPKVL